MRLLLLTRDLAAAALLATSCATSCGGSTSSGSPATGGSSRLFVTVYGTDEIVAIDLASQAVTQHIPLGTKKGPAILLKTPDGKKLYADNWKDSTLSVVDVATSAVTSIALGSRAWVEAMSPKGDVLYVGLNSNQIGVISTATDTLTGMIDTGGQLPESIIVSPDGNTLYVALVPSGNPLGGSLEAMATDGTIVHAAIPVGSAPAWVTISPDGSKVYTLNFLGDSVSVVDSASWTVSATVSVHASSSAKSSADEPIIGAVTPAGALLVTNFNTANVVVIDPATNALTHALSTNGRPVGVDVSADGTQGYVSVFGPDSLNITPSPLSLLSGDLTSSIGTDPGSIVVFDPATGLAVGNPISVGGAGPTSVVAD